MIIGVTGTLGAGKGTVVEYLKTRGFRHYSVRDFLTDEIVNRRMTVNRDSMVIVANDLRARFGSSYIIQQLYEKAEADEGDAVIESLRAVGEVEALKKKDEFILFAVDADIQTRYSRITERGSSTDDVSFDEFVANEEREMRNTDPSKGNIKACMEMADYTFKNDWTIDELHRKVTSALEHADNKPGATYHKEEFLEEVKRPHIRPTWDEYFMEICRSVAKRATCDRGRSGCVIARDKQILVTGYVGAPAGLTHCDEVGHQMEATIHEDGVKRDHCIRTTHAEQNAICQAAKRGVSIDRATLYCKMMPCQVCAKMIINSGIKRVVCEKLYQSGAKDLMEQAGIRVEVLVNEVEKY